MLAQFKTYGKMWTTLKRRPRRPTTATFKQPLHHGQLANITIVPVKPARPRHKRLVETAVLRAGRSAAAPVRQKWNDTVGKALGRGAVP
jgi:hypothetical protein